MDKTTSFELIDNAINQINENKSKATCKAHESLAEGVKTLLILSKQQFYRRRRILSWEQIVLIVSITVFGFLSGLSLWKTHVKPIVNKQETKQVHPIVPKTSPGTNISP